MENKCKSCQLIQTLPTKNPFDFMRFNPAKRSTRAQYFRNTIYRFSEGELFRNPNHSHKWSTEAVNRS
jgi:hypothetical protein